MHNLKHSTSLTSHLHEARLWYDFVALIVIWVLAMIVDHQIIVLGISVVTIFKVIGMVGLLEAFSFVAFHWLGLARGVLMQGFLGGFMSSTTVFMQLTQMSKASLFPPSILSRALLLATLAMVIECVLIIYAVAPRTNFIVYSMPLFVQGACICLAVWLLPKRHYQAQVLDLDVLSNHPISWLKVMRLSAFIIALIWTMRWLNQTMQLSLIWSSFLLSIFEAHAVLAASMIELSPNSSTSSGLQIIIAMLLGNTISKCSFVVRTRNRTLIVYVVGALIASILAVVVVYLLLMLLKEHFNLHYFL